MYNSNRFKKRKINSSHKIKGSIALLHDIKIHYHSGMRGTSRHIKERVGELFTQASWCGEYPMQKNE